MAGGVVLFGDRHDGPVDAPWAGPLLALGARLARRAPASPDTRLIVALTVPTRDLAAVLIAAGWVLTRPARQPGPPAAVLPSLTNHTPVLLLAGRYLFAETFHGSREVRGERRVHVGGSEFQLDKIEYLMPAPKPLNGRNSKIELPLPGSLVTSAHHDHWRAAQISCGANVVVIGTKAWITSEMEVRIGRRHSTGGNNSFAELLRPDDGVRPSWGSAVLPAARFEEAVVPPEAELVILDGNSAIGWLSDLSCEVTVAIIDRSVADDFAADSLLQARSMGACPVSLDGLGWHAPPGVEALAFEAWR